MKAQTKALVASVVVIALALSAVSGITYSWWSDTENSDITITTGDLDVSTSDITVGYTESGEAKTKSVAYADTLSISYGGANASSATLALDTSKVNPNDDVTISYAVTFKATVNVKYLLDVDVPTTFESVTTTEVTLNGTTFSDLGVYKEDTTNALDKTYSVVITISELPRNATGIFKLTNYITQLPNTDAQAGTQDVSEGSATVTAGDASVAVSSIPDGAKTLKVVTTTDDSADTASIYLTLTDSSGNKITDFDSAVTVEVVLKGAYNGLYYNGTEAQPTVSSYKYSTDKTSWEATFETAKYTKVTFTTTHFSEFVAISTVEVSDASTLATAIAAGGYVKLGADVTDVSSTIEVNTETILDLNNHSISTSSIEYLMKINKSIQISNGTLQNSYTGGNSGENTCAKVLGIVDQSSGITLSLKNVNVTGPTVNNYNRAIWISGNSGNIVIKVTGGTITSNHYPLDIGTNTGSISCDVEDATLEGYCAVRTFSKADMTFTNCILSGVNHWSGSDNDHGVIVIGKSRGDTEPDGTVMNIVKSTIKSQKVDGGTAKEWLLRVRCSEYTITLDDCTYNSNGTAVTMDTILNGQSEQSEYSWFTNAPTRTDDGTKITLANSSSAA